MIYLVVIVVLLLGNVGFVAYLYTKNRKDNANDLKSVAREHEASIIKRAEAEKLDIADAAKKAEAEAHTKSNAELERGLNEWHGE